MPKLLLADDSPTTQKVVQLTFADEGIDVVVADDGDTALELYEHHHPDIVLADINIPGLNGYEVCEAIRKRDDNGSTPVILLAGSFEPFDVEQAHRVGANDYLTKPFSSIRRLVATVTALLDSVVRQDTAAEETIEPNSVPPDASEAEREPVASEQDSPDKEPGPTLPPEPDPYATDDIENLINQSLVETVEMPHTVAERVMSEIAAAKEAEQSNNLVLSRDEVAFDDELIETTFANEPDGSLERTDLSDDRSAAVEVVDEAPPPVDDYAGQPDVSTNGYSDVPAPEFRVEPLDEQFAPPEVDDVQPAAEAVEAGELSETSDLSQAPTEEFQIDQSGDETYFEPAPEAVEHPDERPPAPASHDEPIAESSLSSQPIENPGDVPSAEEQETELQPENDDASEPHAVTEHSAKTATLNEGPEPAQTSEIGPTSTPWDSVAEPRHSHYSLDETNLLELPFGFANRGSNVDAEKTNEISTAVSELAPEIVDEIARATALQISEELVREIANRIVPKVVEEVLSRHRGENSEH